MSPAKLNLAVDIANYAGYLEAATLESWKAAGVSRVIVRASTEDNTKVIIALQQMQTVLENKIELQVYLWIYLEAGMSIEQQVSEALKLYGDMPITYWWLDLEAEADKGIDVIPSIVEAVAAIGDRSVGIYTRRSWWIDNAYDSDAFKHLPLWDAHYTGRATFDDFVPYGGWTKPAMVQYAGDVPFGGVNVDLNVYQGS